MSFSDAGTEDRSRATEGWRCRCPDKGKNSRTTQNVGDIAYSNSGSPLTPVTGLRPPPDFVRVDFICESCLADGAARSRRRSEIGQEERRSTSPVKRLPAANGI